MRHHHKSQHLKFAKQHLDEPKAFWKQVRWTDDIIIDLSITIKGVLEEKK